MNEIAQIRIVLLDDMFTKGLSEAAKEISLGRRGRTTFLVWYIRCIHLFQDL